MKIINDYEETKLRGIIEIISASYIGNCKITISFSNSTEKSVDLKPFLTKSLHPSISKYLDERLFKNFQIVDGNLNWNDYELIFPVHDLYEGIIK